MQCPSCSEENPDFAKFCTGCGSSLASAAPADTVPAPPEPAPTGNIAPPPGATEIDSLAGTAPTAGAPASAGDASASPATEPASATAPPETSAPVEPPGPPAAPPAAFAPAVPAAAPPAAAPPAAAPPPVGGVGYAAPAPAPAPAAAPVLAAPPVPTAADPFALGGAAGRMSPEAQGIARSALVATAVLMVPGERVESVCQGTVEGAPGLMVLTDRRLLVLNQRDWAPFVTWFAVDATFALQPWEDGTGATINVSGGGRTAVISGIDDKQPAYDLVARINRRLGR